MRGLLLAASLFWSGVAWADIPRPNDISETLGHLAEAYRASGEFDHVEVDRSDLSVILTSKAGGAFTSYPDNLHQMLQQAEDDGERREVLDTFVASLIEQIELANMPLDRSMIVPVVRSFEFAQDLDGAPPVSDEFVGDLRIYYAFDHPLSISYVSETSLGELGLRRDDLADLAWDNLVRLEWAPEVLGDGIWFLDFDGNYEATFLLNDAMWNGFDEQLDTILMMALARDLVLFTDGGVEGAQGELLRIADEMAGELSYPLSELLYEWTANGWAVRDKR